MPEPSSETYAAMQRQPWDEIIPRLVQYALKKSRRRYWQGIFGGWMPGGQEASDIAMQAIEKLLTGERHWDPKEQPEILKVLTSVVDSIISHLVRSWENKRVRSHSSLAANSEENGGSMHQLEPLADPSGSPLDAAVKREEDAESNQFLSDLHRFLADDPELQQAIDSLSDGCTKRSELAAQLSLSPPAMTNLRKRLQNRVKSFLKARKEKDLR